MHGLLQWTSLCTVNHYLNHAALQAGFYLNLAKEYSSTFYGPSLCDAEAAAAEAAGFEAMDEMDMLAPLFGTFFCTTVGLIVFFTCPYAYFELLSHPGLGTAEDIKLRDELLSLTVSQLRHRAKAAEISDEDVGQALDQDQDDGAVAPLAELVLNAECSPHRKALVELHEMTIAGLVQKATAVGVSRDSLDAALDNSIDIHHALVCTITGLLDTDGDGQLDAREAEAMEMQNPIAVDNSKATSEAATDGATTSEV